MAYNSSKYQLTRLLADAWYRMGQMKTWKATGGNQTTFVNSLWAGVEEPFYEDNDPALVYGTVVVIKDVAGLGAAPEGEMAQITAYDSSSNTVTLDTLTTGIAAGDKVGIASPLFPMEDMIRLSNIAIRKLGEIDIRDTSLTVISNQTEYALPSTIQRYPVRVRVQTNKVSSNNFWVDVNGWQVLPATAGSNWTLVIPREQVGYTLEVTYRSLHPELTAFDSEILPTIHPELILNALLAEAYQWYNDQVNGSNEYFLQRENKALQDLDVAKVRYPIRTTVEQVSGLPHWNSKSKYVPLTNDLAE
jgi:hypothetical protein